MFQNQKDKKVVPHVVHRLKETIAEELAIDQDQPNEHKINMNAQLIEIKVEEDRVIETQEEMMK
jgi:hypothetical protein